MAMEIERKFRMSEGSSEPITDLGGVALLGTVQQLSLRATYFDATDLRLARRGITLRRRTGGHDEGWHLKLPATEVGVHARREIAAPIVPGASPTVVPAALREHLDLASDQPLVPIAQMDTERRETDLVDANGIVLATLCEDQVTVRRTGRDGQPEVQQWREVEVELAHGTPTDLEEISRELVARGAEPQPPTSKLVQALGDLLTEPGQDAAHNSAAQVVGAYLATQVGVVQTREADVRADAPDAVHKMRVATRRLRSTLRTFVDIMDAERVTALRDEIKWLADMLGGPRDAEVLRTRLMASFEALPPEVVVGPVRERLTHELNSRHAEAHRALVEALDSERHHQLQAALAELVARPPFTEAATRPADEVLPRLLDKATRRVTRRWKQAQVLTGEAQTELAHEARKKAKAARYAWEAVASAFANGKQAASTWEEVTESLGTAQDTVVARERLLEISQAAHAAGEPTFTYGVMYALELEHQDDAHDVAGRAIRAARKASRIPSPDHVMEPTGMPR